MAKYAATDTYTDQELLDLYREAYARISVSGQSYEIAGRVFKMADLRFIQQQIEWLERRIDTAAAGITSNQVHFRRPL